MVNSTGAINQDPTNGQPNLLYYDQILRSLSTKNFQPGMSPETVRDDKIVLPALTNHQWDNLEPLGKLQVGELVFARGTSKLSSRSKLVLDELVDKLKTWPDYYVIIRGNSSTKGDLEANKKLSLSRATTAMKYLIDKKVHQNRVKAVGGTPSGRSSVTFVLGRP